MELVITDEKDERFITLSNALDEEYYEIHGDKVLKYKRYNQLDDYHFVLLALNYNKAIACASFRVIDKDSIEIRRVYVTKRHRKKHIAYKLIKQLEKIAIDYGYKYSYIETGIENSKAISLYKKLDYKIIDNFGFFKNDDFCVCMKKEFKSLI